MKNMRSSLSVVLLALVCACSSPSSPKREQVIGDWQVMVSGQATNSMLCYAGATPDKTSGTVTTREGKAYLMVTRRVSGKIEISASSGYHYKAGSKVELAVDDDTYNLFFKDSVAWARSDKDDRAIVKNMQEADTIEVRGLSKDGLTSIDRYSAEGFAQAVADIRKLCP